VDVTSHYAALANLERLAGKPAQVLEWMLPLVRLRAFEARLKRILKALDAKGMIDPDTGLMIADAFWRELDRVVVDTQRAGAGLCIARFVFDMTLDRRVSLDAARLVGGIIRNIDFACREADGAVMVVFTETDLRSANVIARRIVTALRSSMQITGDGSRRPQANITLATLKPMDTLDTLVARVGSQPVAAA
jgi:GGDEF domain-containing protein